MRGHSYTEALNFPTFDWTESLPYGLMRAMTCCIWKVPPSTYVEFPDGAVMKRSVAFAVLGGALLVQPAFGDTRDDVYAAMQRCRILQDDRAWLDCAYGAQQPMRARLGLSPAPEFQQRLVPPAASSSAAAVAPQRMLPSAQSRPSVQPHHRASLMQILTGSAAPVAVSALASVQYDSQGAFVATLQNAQVWRQVNALGERAPLKVGARITVTPGALGSYNLQASDVPHTYKVELKS
jgi:hypothetical protein